MTSSPGGKSLLIETRCSQFDIIGDVHGCADALSQLLLKLGYRQRAGVYHFPDGKRQVIFVGDVIDRGPQIRETLAIVRSMVDQGAAHIVIGNHEFNAVAYFTKLEQGYLRAHNPRAQQQIQATLDAFAAHPEEWQDYLDWFARLPLFLEFEHFRVVHACWDQARIAAYWQRFNSYCLSPERVQQCADYTSVAARAVERLTRGVSLKLPHGYSIKSRDGFERRSFRVHFWAENAECYDDIVFQPDPLPAEMRAQRLDAAEQAHLRHYTSHEKPLFIGHYWLQGEPALVAANIACLDYSAVNNGKLVAYCFDTRSPILDPKHFVFVESDVNRAIDIENDLSM